MYSHNNTARKYNLYIITIALPALFFIYRLLLPFGDEPDFGFRVQELLDSDIFNLYLFKDIYISTDYNNTCMTHWSQTSIFGHIDSFFCGNNFYLEMARWLNNVLMLFLFLTFLLAKSFSFNSLNLSQKDQALLYSLFVPSVIFYLGIIGLEALALYVSLYVFVVKELIPKILLISLLFIFDEGVFIVVALFYSYFFICSLVFRKFGLGGLVLFSSTLVFISLFLGLFAVQLLSNVPIIGSKASLIYEHYSTVYSYVYTNFPVVLRPFITFFTGSFMLPSGVKAILANFAFMVIFAFIFWKLFFAKSTILNIGREKYHRALLYCISPLSFIMIFVYILPGFANAKYYVFLVPFLIYSYSILFSYRNISIFLISVNAVVLLTLFAARI